MKATTDEVPRTAWVDRHILGILACICVLGAAMRLYRLGHYSLWYDECASLYLRRFVDLHGSLFQFNNTTEPPMMAVLTYLWYGLIRAVVAFPVISEANDFAIRLLPCAFGIAAVPLTFLVARTLFQNARAGLVAAYVCAINPFQIYYAQELRIYTFLAMLSLLAVYLTFQALETGRPRYWIAFVAVEVVMMYSHFMTVWFIFAINLWFLASAWHYRKHFWRWVGANAVLMVCIVPSLIMAWRMNKMVMDLWPPFYEPPTWKTGLITLKSLFAWFGPRPWVYWPLFILACGLLVVGLWPSRARWRVPLLLGALVVVPMVSNVILWSARDFSFYEHRLFILSGIAAIIAVGHGIVVLRTAWIMGAVLALFTGFTSLALQDMYRDRIHPVESHRLAIWNKVDFRAAATCIEGHRHPSDGVLVSNHFLIYPLNHYLSEPVTRVGIVPEEADAFVKHMGNGPLLRSHGLVPAPIAEIAPKYERIWYVQSFGTTFEWQPTSEAVRAWLTERLPLAGQWEFDGLRVYLFETPKAAP